MDVDSVTKRKCIQFIDERGTTYALKVINSTNRVRFEVGKNNLNGLICTIYFTVNNDNNNN